MEENQFRQRRKPRQARARATHDSILEAALQLIARNGADALNTNAIAERAGVSIGTLYQYFPDKDAILLAAARRALDDRSSPGRSLFEALIHALERLLESPRLGRASRSLQRSASTVSENARRISMNIEEAIVAVLMPSVPILRRVPIRRR
ncbi:MAG: helix-turn-helix transcriptional regulator [Proteobacteria bacterium]|nr:helix-turn-helix transcriptional regulator [Pseudomonadota bacterium]